MSEDQNEHELKMARIRRSEAIFAGHPRWYTIWDVATDILRIAFWLGFWAIVAQCSCNGCIWHGG